MKGDQTMTFTEGKLTQLRRERDVLQQQADALTVEMSNIKPQRHALEEEKKRLRITLDVRTAIGDLEAVKAATTRLAEIEHELTDTQNSLQNMNSRTWALQRDRANICAEISRVETAAANLAARIHFLKHDLRLGRSRQPLETHSPAFATNLAATEAELQECEDRYRALTGEVLPPIAA
jgi:chromosome segregation ATPase